MLKASNMYRCSFSAERKALGAARLDVERDGRDEARGQRSEIRDPRSEGRRQNFGLRNADFGFGS
jgi:hypothetical protein